MAAIDDLNSLLSGLPNYASLTTGMKNAALEGARIPDSSGVWPGEVGYVTTYDVHFAALNLIGFLMAQPVVRQTSSEGTSVAVDAPKWDVLMAYYRSMSPILAATGNTVLQSVPIPDGPHVKRMPMRGGAGNDDVDTDLA